MKMAYGRLRLSPEEWGSMTLTEFSYAVEGFNDLESERLKWSLYTTRRLCYYILQPHLEKGSSLKETDLFPISGVDSEIEKARIEDLPIVKVVEDGTGN